MSDIGPSMPTQFRSADLEQGPQRVEGSKVASDERSPEQKERPEEGAERKAERDARTQHQNAVSIHPHLLGLIPGQTVDGQIGQVADSGQPVIQTRSADFAIETAVPLNPGDLVELRVTAIEPVIRAVIINVNNTPLPSETPVVLTVVAVKTIVADEDAATRADQLSVTYTASPASQEMGPDRETLSLRLPQASPPTTDTSMQSISGATSQPSGAPKGVPAHGESGDKATDPAAPQSITKSSSAAPFVPSTLVASLLGSEERNALQPSESSALRARALHGAAPPGDRPALVPGTAIDAHVAIALTPAPGDAAAFKTDQKLATGQGFGLVVLTPAAEGALLPNTQIVTGTVLPSEEVLSAAVSQNIAAPSPSKSDSLPPPPRAGERAYIRIPGAILVFQTPAPLAYGDRLTFAIAPSPAHSHVSGNAAVSAAPMTDAAPALASNLATSPTDSEPGARIQRATHGKPVVASTGSKEESPLATLQTPESLGKSGNTPSDRATSNALPADNETPGGPKKAASLTTILTGAKSAPSPQSEAAQSNAGAQAAQMPLGALAPFDPAKPWQSIERLVEQLATVAPEAATALAGRLSIGSPKLANSILFLMAALGAKSSRTLLGPEVFETVQSKFPDLLSRTQRALEMAGGSPREVIGGEWRAMSLPLQAGDSFLTLALLFKSDGEAPRQGYAGDEEAGDDEDNQDRFIVEVAFSGFGRVQLDGMFKSRRLDLIVRSETPLGATLERNIGQAFGAALEQGEMGGSLMFRALESNDINALEIAGHIPPSTPAASLSI